jgi:L-aminopeptidase/D-esterase-like protein
MAGTRAWLYSAVLVSILAGATARADRGALAINTAATGPVLSFDWPALEIGIGSYEAGPTGVTVIRFANRASVAVDVRGGAVGTVNTDALRQGYGNPFVDAIVFSGGSAYGEEAITAVATALKDDGLRSGAWRGGIAFVPGAIIYDFGGRRLNEIYPDKRLAQAAFRARQPGVFPLGAQGAGRMAMQGGFFGCDAHSGQGGAFAQVGATKIAAFAVVNAHGAVVDRDGRLARCPRAPGWGELDKVATLLRHLPDSRKPDWRLAEAGPTRNTTVSLVVTNQKLEAWALQRLAVQVHTAMSRAIQPFATQSDGDTLFAASTQEVDNNDLDVTVLSTIASETMWDAVLASVPPDETVTLPTKPVKVDPATLARYAGTYRFESPLGRDAPPPGGSFVGAGVDLAMDGDALKVTLPFADGPAAKAGVQRGDVITHIGEQPIRGLSFDQAIAKFPGPIGSPLKLRLTRAGQEAPIDVTIVRELIRLRMPTLTVRVVGDTLQVEANRQVYEFGLGKPIALVALSDNEFVVDGRYRTRLAFTRDAAGGVSGAVLNPGRWAQAGRRVE